MVYSPALAVINAGVIADNLLAYLVANQSDALVWAGGPALKTIKKFSASVANRAVPVYPSIAFSDDNDAADYTDDVTDAAYSVTFEIGVQNPDPDTAVTQAKVYRKAFVSLIRNCPQATLTAGTGAIAGTAVLHTIETGFDPIRTNDQQNDFLQMFQIKAAYSMKASAY